MGKGLKNKSASHQLYKDKAKNRVDDLQDIFIHLQSARKDSRTSDVTVLEEQVQQMLREWKFELNEPSPASSLHQGGSLGSFPSSEIYRLMHPCEEEDDATSALAAPKPEPCVQKVPDGSISQEQVFNNIPKIPEQLDYPSFDPLYFPEFDGTNFIMEDDMPAHIPPPAYAFLGPKCCLWDCTRPALGLEWSQKSDDYCSIYHAELAPTEGHPGTPPVLRPGGIGLKDNLLFAALSAKAQEKDVGVPECEGAATTKSPWNAPELFDLTILDGETIREWLFFDKPRRAFESGNRKQRSLPDYNGRGWHESRKQVVHEFEGLKRSYYMDPQPMESFEWHLYEYVLNKYSVCALYRLELKRVEKKKTPKGKLSNNDSVADLQKQMGRLTAEIPIEKPRAVKGRGKVNMKDATKALENPSEGFDYIGGVPEDYLVENIDGYYLP